MLSRLLKVPLFPLATNILPGGLLPLQIFEPRYLDMIKSCMSNDVGFVVVLDADGKDTKTEDIRIRSLGTYVEVVDFDQLENGLLGITAKGKFRARIMTHIMQEDFLLVGEIEELLEENSSKLEEYHKNIWQVLKKIMSHPEVQKMEMEVNFNSSSSVIYSLGSLLPLSADDKQVILEADSDKERLEFLEELITKFGGGSNFSQDLQA